MKVDDEKIMDIAATVDWKKDMVLSVGKKYHYRV